MSKHTPGPWQPLTFSNHELQTDFAMVAIGKRAHIIGYGEEDQANARLIAAAPALYEYVASKSNSGDNEASKLLEMIHGRA